MTAGTSEIIPEIRIISAPGVLHLAVITNTTLLDYALWYPGHPDGLGNIYHGRVTAYLPAIGGAFVQLENQLSGFLSDNAGAKNHHEGDRLVVRITRSAQGGKGVRLDARNLTDFQDVPSTTTGLLQKGPTPLEELAQRWPKSPVILDRHHLLDIIPQSCRPRVHFESESVSAEILHQIHALKDSHIELPNGMMASITPTPALTAIDMDSASQSQEKQGKYRAQFNANKKALPDLLRQLTLRNLSGAILIDLIGLPVKKRRLLQRDIEQALTADPLFPKLLGFTHLGLAEIIRPRKRPPLHEMIHSDHGTAIHILDLLMQNFHTMIDHSRYHRIKLTLNIACYQALIMDQWAIKDFETRCQITLSVESDPSFTRKKWEFSYE